ncbi:hypothetical protein D9757_004164 [Collybiopsis confluens]|uniref:Methyltransferase domain-containing protein n=1 Tax=Collybiopsis confluens TaxID=2823264 RepID=A0A8H5HUI6_9AGAR|nr:hypothetical protein D9757_004164 [Collybiopsis confluens]
MHPSPLRTVADSSSRSPQLASKFDVDSEDLALLRQLTGIHNVKELENHITEVQNKANYIKDYPCIGMFTFTKFNIKFSPNYNHALSLSRTRQNAIFLDVGCCVGNALRKIVADGWPAQNTIGTDLYREFWDVGHELFKSTPNSFPAHFIPGDLFDDAVLTTAPISSDPQESDLKLAKLQNLTSLTPLRHRVSVIYACNLFHLFTAERQVELAKRLASLLEPSSGSIIFGSHGVSPYPRRTQPDGVSFHTAESFADMWKEVFEPGTVEISWKIKSKPQRKFSAFGRWDIIWWSITYL